MYKDGALKTIFFQAARSLKTLLFTKILFATKVKLHILESLFFFFLVISDTEIQNHFQTIFGTVLNLNLKHVVQARNVIL